MPPQRKVGIGLKIVETFARLPLISIECHCGKPQDREEEPSVMQITIVGLDLAKNVFQVQAAQFCKASPAIHQKTMVTKEIPRRG